MVLEAIHPDVMESQNRSRAKHGHPGEGDDTKGAPNNNWLELLKLAGESLVQSGLQEPINGVDQAVDHLTGKNFLPQLHIVPVLDDERFGSARWLAEAIGSGTGSILPFLLTERLTSKLGSSESILTVREGADAMPLIRSVIGLNESSEYASHLAKTSLDGAIYGGLMVPSYDPNQGFWQQRAKDSLSVAMTFGTQYGVSHGVLNGLEKSGFGHLNFHSVGDLTVTSAATRLGTNLVGGSAAGFVGAESMSLLYGMGPASPDLIKKSIGSFAITGLALDSVHLGQEKLGGQEIVEHKVKSGAQLLKRFIGARSDEAAKEQPSDEID